MQRVNRTIEFTHGETLFLRRALKILRSDINQEIDMYGDEDGRSTSHIRVLDKIIPKLNVERNN